MPHSSVALLPVQAALTLSEEAERSRPFASALGQLMMTQRTGQAAAKQVRFAVQIVKSYTVVTGAQACLYAV